MENQSNKITGVISEVFLKTGTTKEGKPYEVRQILISEVSGRYPQSVLVDAFGEKFNKVEKGMNVECYFNLAANEYNGKYYNRISAWRIVPVEGQTQVEEARPEPQPQETSEDSLAPQKDDLPF